MYTLNEIIERLEEVAKQVKDQEDKYNLEGEIENLKQTVHSLQQIV